MAGGPPFPSFLSLTRPSGAPEIAVQWSDGALMSPANLVDIWKMGPTGKLVPVDLSNVYKEMDAPFASKIIRWYQSKE